MTIIIVGQILKDIAIAIDKPFDDITESDINAMGITGVMGWTSGEEELERHSMIQVQNREMKNDIRMLYEKTLIQKGVIMCNEECIANQRASIEVLILNTARQKMIAETHEEKLSEYNDFIDKLAATVMRVAEIVQSWKDHMLSSDRIAMDGIAHAVEEYLIVDED